MASVSVAILSYKRPKYLKAVLESLRVQKQKPDEIVVVDNKSELSGEIAEICRNDGGVRLLQNEGNVGFARAMNRAVFATTSKYVYVAVDDLTLHPRCLWSLVNFAEKQDPRTIVSELIFKGESDTIACAGGYLDLEVNLKLSFFRQGETSLPQGKEPFEVTYVPGGALLLRRDLYVALGGYREDFFMYHEDTEFCKRASRMNCRLFVVPEAIAYDLDAKHNYPSQKVEIDKIANLFSLYLLHAPVSALFVFYPKYLLSALLRNLGSPALLGRMALALLRFTGRLPKLLFDRIRQKPLSNEALNADDQNRKEGISHHERRAS